MPIKPEHLDELLDRLREAGGPAGASRTLLRRRTLNDAALSPHRIPSSKPPTTKTKSTIPRPTVADTTGSYSQEIADRT